MSPQVPFYFLLSELGTADICLKSTSADHQIIRDKKTRLATLGTENARKREGQFVGAMSGTLLWATLGAAAPPCDRWWDTRAWYFNTEISRCLGDSGQAASILDLKKLGLSCTRRFHASNGLFGTLDNPTLTEYRPTCAKIVYEGKFFLMMLAEPSNSFSSFRAYDPIACVSGAEVLHVRAAFLGWASFNYHASGNAELSANWELDLDYQAQSCFGLRFMQQVSTSQLSERHVQRTFQPPRTPETVLAHRRTRSQARHIWQRSSDRRIISLSWPTCARYRPRSCCASAMRVRMKSSPVV